MTNQEAIKILKNTAFLAYQPEPIEVIEEAVNKAISALQAQADGDCISRRAAIDALVKAIRKDPYYDSNEAINGLGVCDVRVILNDLPSAQSEPQWIPVSERLPEDWVPVLVTLKKPERLPAWIKAKPENYFHIVDADVCENGEWSVNKKNVTAWMPLPEPYRAERRTDEGSD